MRLTTTPKSFGRKLKDKAKQLVGTYDPINRWAKLSRERVQEPAFQRDQAFIDKLLPFMDVFNKYFGSELRGMDLIPKDRPVLLVGNHSGGVLTPDTTKLLATWFKERKDQTLVGLAFDAAFSIPGMAPLMRKTGQVPASHKNALKALELGCSVLVYPGGAHEVFRPWSDRNKIDFGGHKGFVRLALKAGVAVVPIVSHGGHDTTFVLTRGEALAKKFRMDRLRMTVYPILLQFPWGISTPGQPGIPLPAKITMQVLEPRNWTHLGKEAASNEELVNQCYLEVTQAMQQTLTALAEENPRPLLTRAQQVIESLFYTPEKNTHERPSAGAEIFKTDRSPRSVRRRPSETDSIGESESGAPLEAVG